VVSLSKVFEDYFSELQADMVAICLEYCDKKADKVFIYGSDEANVISAGYFYCIGNRILSRDKLTDAKNGYLYDTSVDRQIQVLKILVEDIKSIETLCKEYKREMPAEMKLIYDVNKNSLSANYKYGYIYSNDPEKTADDVEMEWFVQVERETGYS
jgi:hypothetical protein